MKDMHIWIVEDDASYRRTLQNILSSGDGLNCEKVFSSCPSIFESLTTETHPDLILMDLGLPGMSGVEGIQELASLAPDLAVIVLTVFSEKKKVLEALDAGAAGYLLKSATPREILRGIRGVFDGGVVLSPAIAKLVLDEMRVPKPSVEFDLSPRQLQVLQLLADGLSAKLIADKINVSPYTVDFHIKNLYEKLEVQSQAGAIAKAFRSGLL